MPLQPQPPTTYRPQIEAAVRALIAAKFGIPPEKQTMVAFQPVLPDGNPVDHPAIGFFINSGASVEVRPWQMSIHEMMRLDAMPSLSRVPLFHIADTQESVRLITELTQTVAGTGEKPKAADTETLPHAIRHARPVIGQGTGAEITRPPRC